MHHRAMLIGLDRLVFTNLQYAQMLKNVNVVNYVNWEGYDALCIAVEPQPSDACDVHASCDDML